MAEYPLTFALIGVGGSIVIKGIIAYAKDPLPLQFFKDLGKGFLWAATWLMIIAAGVYVGLHW